MSPHKLHWRMRLYMALEVPKSSKCARLVNFAVFFVVLMSIATFCIETVPALAAQPDFALTLDYLDIFYLSFFGVEFALRVLAPDGGLEIGRAAWMCSCGGTTDCAGTITRWAACC